MGVSEKLAILNVNRYQNWLTSPAGSDAKQALLAFKGDIYAAMDADRYKIKDFDFAQKHLRILSGLYGILRPLDLIQPYRLEMAAKLKTDRGQNLYRFWGHRINTALNKLIKHEKSGVVINLAVFFAWHILWPGATEAAPFSGRFEWFSLLITVVAFLMLWRFKVGIIPVIGASAAAGLGWSKSTRQASK